DGASKASTGRPGSRFKGKHSLDSDEEDDEEEQDAQKYDILATEDIEGEGTGGGGGEGHGAGREEVALLLCPLPLPPDVIRSLSLSPPIPLSGDRLSGGLAAYHVRRISPFQVRVQPRPVRAEADEGNAEPLTDVRSLLEGILGYLQPGETVAKALRRLGSARVERPKRKRRRAGGGGGEQQEDSEKEKEERGEAQSLDSLTSLADQMVAWGEFEIYQETYERIRYRLRKARERPAQAPAHREALDMFAEQIDESELLVKAESPPGQGIYPPPTSQGDI
ncbi:CD2 antigen cytoplasmic tail-binding protein 2, partial [Chiloscyllium plagiosum]|uniref:CD2 antigen cytoplasmic tail-binding protein 2 n=1 Tax=Chiloscyllium plagiosum TaxID=36176 RepID=UPI001CB7C9FF